MGASRSVTVSVRPVSLGPVGSVGSVVSPVPVPVGSGPGTVVVDSVAGGVYGGVYSGVGGGVHASVGGGVQMSVGGGVHSLVVVGSGSGAWVVVGSGAVVSTVLAEEDVDVDVVELFLVLVDELDEVEGWLVDRLGAGGRSATGAAPARAQAEDPQAKTAATARAATSRAFIDRVLPGRGS